MNGGLGLSSNLERNWTMSGGVLYKAMDRFRLQPLIGDSRAGCEEWLSNYFGFIVVGGVARHLDM